MLQEGTATQQQCVEVAVQRHALLTELANTTYGPAGNAPVTVDILQQALANQSAQLQQQLQLQQHRHQLQEQLQLQFELVPRCDSVALQ